VRSEDEIKNKLAAAQTEWSEMAALQDELAKE
jgi:hypothetical protein